mgnify:CR=1 FL=1
MLLQICDVSKEILGKGSRSKAGAAKLEKEDATLRQTLLTAFVKFLQKVYLILN